MTNSKIKRYILLLVFLGLSAGFSIAQDQSEFDDTEMLPPPETMEDADIEEMAPPSGFEEDASESYRMRRPLRRRGQIGSGTMDMQPPEFDENASGTMRMRRPPMGGRPPMGDRPPMTDTGSIEE